MLYTYDTFDTLVKDMIIHTSKQWKEGTLMIKDAEPQYNKSSGSELRKAFSKYLEIYTPDPQVKDTVIANIEKKLRIPIIVEVQALWNRIDLLFDYINQL